MAHFSAAIFGAFDARFLGKRRIHRSIFNFAVMSLNSLIGPMTLPKTSGLAFISKKS